MFFLLVFEQYFAFFVLRDVKIRAKRKCVLDPEGVEHFLFIDVLCRKSAPDKSVDWSTEDRQIDDMAGIHS